MLYSIVVKYKFYAGKKTKYYQIHLSAFSWGWLFLWQMISPFSHHQQLFLVIRLIMLLFLIMRFRVHTTLNNFWVNTGECPTHWKHIILLFIVLYYWLSVKNWLTQFVIFCFTNFQSPIIVLHFIFWLAICTLVFIFNNPSFII